ncbi:pleckstrin homology domain-containing family A member 5 isoform X5 [Latimeria chalumnae]|uniref:pleckstrin homology domain-containing family A member 5 isoform X5 n=1 Tax=Latimeria chalumnae TaxID=7897 RepID=UPI0006D90D7B|nr:PREDICTED: pleckstrin homology domain-containing family A member 5 isoform X5 [Latimeria chalumnae]|eukprot:XP_014347638.1 PREDICTED: pleckstrin homology domain-containing family A member 5 isoform X5 [Latimeria chalumnae]
MSAHLARSTPPPHFNPSLDMAADLNRDWIASLPLTWSYGVTRDGRVFFINEEAKSTTWLHPVSGEAVVTGHRKTPDLPTGWEEGYTFEGARCYINHNERKVTCKHPVTGQPSQENCIFLVNEKSVAIMASQEKKDRPVSMISEASNYTTASEYAVHPASPLGRSSRSSKKVHNFGKRSNSIKRNPNAPVVKRSWLYKQDSTGMKLWKKRWFVLSDLCLFYYRDEKEEGILGSILLPSFTISLIAPEDHINRKYAFKATHPNMRTYYFCTDTAKEMESWMKAMTDAALLQIEPIKRTDKTKSENVPLQEINSISNHKLLTKPESQNNQKNKEVSGKIEEKKAMDAEKYGFQKDGKERPLTKINSIKQQPFACERDYMDPNTLQAGQYKFFQVNGSGNRTNDISPADTGNAVQHRALPSQNEPERVMQRTNSMLQLEQWVRTQRGKGQDDETRSVTTYQTLPRNMPSYRAQVVPRYPEGYRTLPRNSMARPDSISSVSPAMYDRTLGPVSSEDKRKSMRDDTLWQLYEWQQRQFCSRPGTLLRHGTLSSPKTMINISEQASHSIPPSPSHGSLATYQGYSPLRSYNLASRSEVSSPVFRGDVTLDRRFRPHFAKHVCLPDRRSMPAGLPLQPITPQSLQGKTPEELTLLLIKLRRQQAELSSIREHTLVQLMQLNLDGTSPKNEILSHHLQRNLMYLDYQMKENEPLITMVHTMIENSAPRPQLYQQVTQDEYRSPIYNSKSEELDIDAKLSRLCEQDKIVRAQEEKLRQLHKEKYTLEQALLSASQEIEMNADNPAAIQNVVLQRDDLQNGLLSTCREVSRATAELERAWRDYDKLEIDVTEARNYMKEQLERLGEDQTDSANQQHAQLQKDLWRIQDVMEGLSKYKQQRDASDGDFFGPKLFSSAKYKNEGPDYRLYKSEPELTTVAEVDETNGDEKVEVIAEKDVSSAKGWSTHYPVGVIPPRAKSPMPESSTIASYVTLRKNKKIDLKMERPRSAVEQLCLAEVSRPRMSLEEQMERLKRHQQASLKEKKKGLNLIGVSDQSPLKSPSFSRDFLLKPAQFRRRDDDLSGDIRELEAAVRDNYLESNHETPAEEIARLKEAVEPEQYNVDISKELLKPDKVQIPERYVESEPEESLSPEEMADKQKKVERIKALITRNSLQAVAPVNHKTEVSPEEETGIQEQEKIINISYDLATEASRRSKLVAVKSMSSPPQSPTSNVSPTQAQLTEGSHFISSS